MYNSKDSKDSEKYEALDARERAREALQIAAGNRRDAKRILSTSDARARYWVGVMSF